MFFNPLSSAILFLGIGLFAKGKRAGVFIIVTDVILSFILYANVVYYRFNNDFITLPTLTQTSNFGSLGGSILDLVAWHDVFYMFDLIILITLFIKTKTHWSARRMSLRKPMTILTDRKSTRLNSSHVAISYAVFCL